MAEAIQFLHNMPLLMVVILTPVVGIPPTNPTLATGALVLGKTKPAVLGFINLGIEVDILLVGRIADAVTLGFHRKSSVILSMLGSYVAIPTVQMWVEFNPPPSTNVI